MFNRILLVFVLLASVAIAQTSVLTNDMIINMVKSGVPEDVIVRTIQFAPRTNFHFTSADLDALAQE